MVWARRRRCLHTSTPTHVYCPLSTHRLRLDQFGEIHSNSIERFGMAMDETHNSEVIRWYQRRFVSTLYAFRVYYTIV